MIGLKVKVMKKKNLLRKKKGNSVTSDKVAETTKTVESVSSAFDELFNQNA